MRKRIALKTKKLVKKRADGRCEYCQVHENDSFLPFEIDHIVSLKHGGGNEIENLAYTCPQCNQFKGTDLTTFLKSYHDISTIFNPRIYNWVDHFQVDNGKILALTRIGEATIKLLKLNEAERLIHRQILSETGAYPF